MKSLKIILPLALAAIIGGCVLYTFPDLGPWDFEDGSFPSNFTTSSINPWGIDNSTDYDEGDHCLQSGYPDAGESSTLTLTIPAGLDDMKDIHFYYKMSSAGYNDTLTFRVNGIEKKRYTGLYYSWTEDEVSDQLKDTSPNVLEWVYTRSASSTYPEGSNCAWIDYVEIDG